MANHITSLNLTNFRNHLKLSQTFSEKSIIIIGNNGTGKTNILESISLLAPGKGFRNSKFEEMSNRTNLTIHWRNEVSLKSDIGYHQIKLELAKDSRDRLHKYVEYDGSKARNNTELLDLLSIIWLTPQMDQLVSGPASDRRKFFDRIVFNFYPEHIKTISLYEKLLKERAEVLKISRHEKKWLEALEEKIAEYGIAAAAARIEVCEFLQKIIFSSTDAFPQAILSIENDLEQMLTNSKSLEVESYFRKKLHDNRDNDFITGRTNTGIHRTDLVLYHKDKNMTASCCSTGEQKALLVNLVLAGVYGLIVRKNSSPILLLDEIVAHLDDERRKQLFFRVNDLGIQSWMTGTEEDLFSHMGDRAEFYILNETGLKEREIVT